MTCPSCGEPIRPGARFCLSCGTRLELTCPSCGAVLPSSARFCDACGTALTGSTDFAAPSASQDRPPTISRDPSAPPPPVSVELPFAFAGGRYQVRRFLGEGGRKRVYLAYDTALDREVAVATVKVDDLDEGGLLRVRREAQAMGRLGDHPHIVTIHDIGEEDGRPFIVSQYMPGGGLDERLREAEGHRLPVPEAIRIADEVCSALEHAHPRGIVHRDLKPANVWLTEDGSALLGDFGLAVAAELPRLTTEGMMVGTVAYMPPEQALGREVDARADLYSLGGLLYELLTGRPPFVGNDAVAVISQHLNTPPMAPWWHNPEIPRPLGALVLELLSKSPEDRPATAAVVRRRLSEAAAAGTADSPALAVATGDTRSERLHHSRFVGRTKELAVLKDALEAAIEGRGGLVMVAAKEPGVGRTRLAEEIAVYFRLRDGQVLTGHCHETESALPYLPFVEAIRSYVATESLEALRQELGEGASDVARLVSEIRQRLPDLPSVPHPEGEEERYRLFESVSSFLVNAAQAHSILLVLDDLHWADAPSLRLLSHLARRLKDSRLLVVGTYYDVALHRRHPLSEALAELRRETPLEQVALGPLSFEETVQLIEGMAEQSIGHAERAVVGALHRATEGNPLFVEEIMRHLLTTGGARWEEGRWVFDATVTEELTVPEGVRDLIAGRLSRLSPVTNELLTQAAALGRQFDAEVLSHMAGLEEDALLEAVEEALRAQLIVEVKTPHGEPVYTFSQSVVRQTLYEGLSLLRRQRLHRRAADAIEAVHARNLGPHVAALAAHCRLGGAADPEKTIGYSVRAGEAALAVFAYEEAAEHWEAALELLDEQEGSATAQARLLERLSDLKYTTGIDAAGSIECLERALRLHERLGDDERVAQMHSRLGRDLATGTSPATIDIPRALGHLHQAEQILAKGPEGSALGHVYVGLALASVWGMGTEEGLSASERAMQLAERVDVVGFYRELEGRKQPDVPQKRLWAAAASQHAHHLAASGRHGEGLSLVERAWEAADRLRYAVGAFSATWIASVWTFRLGDPRETQRWCRRELATPRQALGQREIICDFLARAHAQAGDLVEAGRWADEAGRARFTTPYVALWEGNWDRAAAQWGRQREEAHRRGNRWAESIGAHFLGVLKHLEGDTAGAELLLQEELTIAVEGRHVGTELGARAELALCLADAGRPDDAEEHVARCREILSQGEDWRGAVGRVALAEAAVVEDRPDEASERYGTAIEVFRRFGLPWDEAEALHRFGRALLAGGDRPGAVETLAGALDLYRRHGAGARWVERVLTDKVTAQGLAGQSFQASIDLVAAAAIEEQPDLRPHASPEGTVTLLFSDIEGSTAANERLGDQRWLEILHLHNRIVRDQVAAHGGFEVKAQGDGFMIAFSSARRAIRCAIGIQRNLATYADKHPDEPIAVRIGLHTGEVMKEAEDFFGANVALAARVAGAAEGGQILVSALLKELVESSGEFGFGPPWEAELKGISGTRRLHAVLWQGSEQP
ncbi:MAG TPA: protein kinase [Acidimicrobiia bacterium]|nr:protein kinase [Acidimicrobiia bacterium]